MVRLKPELREAASREVPAAAAPAFLSNIYALKGI